MAINCTILASSYYRTTRTIGAPIREVKPALVACSASRQRLNVSQCLNSAFNPLIYHEDLVNDELYVRRTQKMMDVRHMLKTGGEDRLKDLRLVDAIQRLGIDHHCQEEIEALIWRQHVSAKCCFDQSEGLHEVSLCFRLLRQEGYYVPPDVFNNFKDEKGKFMASSGKVNVRALMELYEAAQLSIEGEDILDDAAEFSSQLLNALLKYLDEDNAALVKNTLKHPYRKSMYKFKANNFMGSEVEGINGWENCLLELSNADFYMAQGIHRQELLQITKWWKDLGLARELKQARDQPLKWYTWPMAMLNDLRLSDERVELTKSISFIYIIDDIFDLYGKPEELTLFAEAVNRWDLAAVDQLPDYMKKCFRALYDTTNEAGIKIHKKHGFNRTKFLRKTWASLCNAFLVESRWFRSGSRDQPMADEYLKNGKVSSGVHVVLEHVFFLLGFGATNEGPIDLSDASAIISSVAAMLRLWDDLGSAKDEDQNGHDGSYIDYYMKEHQGVTLDIAREHVFKQISEEWKRLNKECLRLNRFSSSFQRASLNLARMVPLMYSYDDNQRLLDLDEFVKSRLYD
nr:(3S,6E)-nerolidol synthase 1-like [Coffea arabica]